MRKLRVAHSSLGTELTEFTQEQAFSTGVKRVNGHVDAL